MLHNFFSRLSFKNYQYLLAFIFAIEEINRNPHLLPNTSLGFELYIVQSMEETILMQAMTWLTGMGINIPNYTYQRKNKAVAVLTGTSWTTSANIGRLLSLYKYPQVRIMALSKIETHIKLLILKMFSLEGKETILS